MQENCGIAEQVVPQAVLPLHGCGGSSSAERPRLQAAPLRCPPALVGRYAGISRNTRHQNPYHPGFLDWFLHLLGLQAQLELQAQ